MSVSNSKKRLPTVYSKNLRSFMATTSVLTRFDGVQNNITVSGQFLTLSLNVNTSQI